ncbi:MAG TPA: response regulator transcription factor [Ardenticatenaceae bacterium]
MAQAAIRLAMTRIFVAAPTPMMRMGLRGMLAEADGVEVVGDAPSLSEYASEVAEADVLVVADDELLGEVRFVAPEEGTLAVLILSEDEEARAVATLRTLPLRGWGLLSPTAATEELLAAISAVSQGLVVLPLELSERMFSSYTSFGTLEPEPMDEPLTPREAEVLELLSQGLSNKMIARQLQISEHTVKFHVSSVYAKLGASSRADAVSRGARRGLITL